MATSSRRLVTLSGPSGVGKGALTDKLRQLAPKLGLEFGRPVLYASRPPRQGEVNGVHFHFATHDEIEALPDDRFVKQDIRAVYQALDMQEVATLLERHELVLAEVFHTFTPLLADFVQRYGCDCELVRVFLSPLTEAETAAIAAHTGKLPSEVIRDEMKRRIMARRAFGLSDETDENLLVRAEGAVAEMATIDEFEVVIVNHQGEESPQWRRADAEAFPVGEAREVFDRFVGVLRGASTTE